MPHSGSSPRPVALAWLERAGDRRYVESETRIGRGEQNNFQLSDPSISRDHALIRRVEGEYILSDLDSSNGTFVNNQRVYEPRRLATGDRVRLANVEFTFNIDQPALDLTQDTRDRPIATSISQFLTISGQIEPQNYLEGDLRVVTVLFLDLCGFTALSERMSPEQITLVVNQCFQHLTETATRFGGFVDKYIGDAMMVLFGAPHAHEDDAERGVRAAIAMQERLAAFSRRLKQRSGIELQMRVGINTGEVLAGSVGSRQFSAYTVMGDTVNLASRLEEHARVGHILVSESTYQLTRHLVRYSASTPTNIRGKHELVNAYEVEDLEPVGNLNRTGRLVGRQNEFAAIERLLLDRRGGCRTAVVHGPAGSGKSRLIEELHHAHVDDAQFVLVNCAELAQDGPSSIAAVVASIESLSREPARERPVVVVFDRPDLADSGTLTLIQNLAASVATCNVVLLVLTRGPTTAWQQSPAIELPPLSAAECEALVNVLLDDAPIDATTLERLMCWTNAWPGVLTEIVQVALDTGQLQVVDGKYQMTAPLDVGKALGPRAKIQSTLDPLSAEDRHVLCLCTVVSEPSPAELIADASGMSSDSASGVLKRLDELGYLARVLVGSTSAYMVRDEMTRMVIDASLTQVERRRLHEQVALALQHAYDPGQPDPERLKQLARHLMAAGQHWQGVEYLLRSADRTAATGSMEAAVDYYRSVLKEAHAVAEARERARLTLEIQDRIGDALLWSGSLAEAQIAFELAAENSASDQRRAELEIKLGVTGLRRGNPRRVLQIGRAILKRPDVTPETRASAEALLSLAMAAHGSVHEAREHAERSITLCGDAPEPAALGLARFAAGRAQFLGGELERARAEYQLSVAAREEAGDRAGVAESHLQLGLVQNALGELDGADAAVRNAVARKDRSEPPHLSHWRDRWTLASAALVLGRLRLDRGDAPRARRHLASALHAAEAIAARELGLEARLELGVVQSATPSSAGGAIDEVRSVLDAALALELRPLACRARVVLGSLLCARGGADAANPGRAREAAMVARDGLVQARSLGLKLHASGARRVLATALAQLGYWPQSQREFDAVVADLEQSGATLELVRTLIAFAEAEYSCAPSPRLTEVRARRARAAQLAQAIGLPLDRPSALHAGSAVGA
ncbi:MAG: FHA domain-containing protein [Chloroflexi bacterium]|nr:FHA domain-containing protein [Chloroflexota bacterium]